MSHQLRSFLLRSPNHKHETFDSTEETPPGTRWQINRSLMETWQRSHHIEIWIWNDQSPDQKSSEKSPPGLPRCWSRIERTAGVLVAQNLVIFLIFASGNVNDHDKSPPTSFPISMTKTHLPPYQCDQPRGSWLSSPPEESSPPFAETSQSEEFCSHSEEKLKIFLLKKRGKVPVCRNFSIWGKVFSESDEKLKNFFVEKAGEKSPPFAWTSQSEFWHLRSAYISGKRQFHVTF